MKSNHRQQSEDISTGMHIKTINEISNLSNFFIIEVRPKTDFLKYWVDPVIGSGSIRQIHGLKQDNIWLTYAWLISKSAVDTYKDTIRPKYKPVIKLLRALNGNIKQVCDGVYLLTK